MTDNQPLRVAILWHMHQPNYQEPGSDRLMMPWVRLHALKDYLDMLLLATRYEGVRTTFNLVPSLLDQLGLYLDGGTDSHLDLTRIPAAELSPQQKEELLDSAFMANEDNLIKPYERYNSLWRKARENIGQRVRASLFTAEEMRDLQVWSHLAWVDPSFRDEEPVRSLFAQERQFTEEQKQALLEWQLNLIARIVPAYRKALDDKAVEVSFTPYYHPILPLLCDTDVAREASPNMELPARRFRHPEDAEWQIRESMNRFEGLFGHPLEGMWPSEGSVSAEVVDLAARLGIKWLASDEEVLYYSLRKSGLDPTGHSPHAVYATDGGLRLVFRDHALSDRIGFVYSGWEAPRAVRDLIGHLKRLRGLLADRLDRAVVPVILDGENAWEYFKDDGIEFLDLLYRHLSEDPELQAVAIGDACSQVEPQRLANVFAGSWINHDFRIWIGHQEDNAAWDLLGETRDTLVAFAAEHPEFDADRLARAWRQIYISEGSDWCWWYGDEHRGAHNEQFDAIFRRHLVAVYELLGLEIPFRLLQPIYRRGAGLKAVLPDSLLTPEIDGRLTHYYEWSGAGHFDCLKAGGAMHRVDRYLARIRFGYDHEALYIRLDFVDLPRLQSLEAPGVEVKFLAPEQKTLRIAVEEWPSKAVEQDGLSWAGDEILEVAVPRPWLWSESHGKLAFAVTVANGADTLETWPEQEPISFVVPEKDMELFWPT